MKKALLALFASVVLLSCTDTPSPDVVVDSTWEVDFFDDFDAFNPENWQDQILWVNNEDQCYLRDGAERTREVSEGTLKLRVIDLGEPIECDNMSKFGEKHPDTQYMAGRLASKNRKEFIKGRWTARLRTNGSGEAGMFPAWWLLGAQNNEPPVEEADETICWPSIGSGEIDIFEHHGDSDPDHYVSRAIKAMGECDGDWWTYQRNLEADLSVFNEFGVEWTGDDLVYLLNGEEVARNDSLGPNYPEPLFAILNYAKISDAPMTRDWEMEVDWVKHERRK